VEALINAAQSIGLNHELAQFLVIETIKGSIELLEKTGEDPAILRKKVSSPGVRPWRSFRVGKPGIRSAYLERYKKLSNVLQN
jgi:pyrroline-5-carboxylate reductase